MSLNAERSGHWRTRHQHTDAWRQKSALLARQALQPIAAADLPIYVEAYPVQKGRTPDAGNAYPTVKAIIDGIVDAGIILDDDPTHVRAVTLHAPTRPDPTTPEHITINLWTDA